MGIVGPYGGACRCIFFSREVSIVPLLWQQVQHIDVVLVVAKTQQKVAFLKI